MKKSNERGASAVEFALLLLPLVLIIFGIIEFGFILYNQQVITNASREGARAGIVYDSTSTPQRPSSLTVKNVVTNFIGSRLITFGTGSLDVNVSYNGASNTSCNATGGNLQISVSYPYKFLVLDSFGFNGPNLTASTTMRCE